MEVLDVAATLRIDVGADAEAARLFGAVHAARERMSLVRPPDPIWDAGHEIDSLRQRLGSDEFTKEWTAGEALNLEDAIAYALRGRGSRQRPAFGWDSLTPTERQVVGLVVEGLTNKQAAEKLFISPRTVSTHLSHAFAKLGVSSRSELTAAAAKRA